MIDVRDPGIQNLVLTSMTKRIIRVALLLCDTPASQLASDDDDPFDKPQIPAVVAEFGDCEHPSSSPPYFQMLIVTTAL